MSHTIIVRTARQELQQTLDDLSIWEGLDPGGHEMEKLADLVATLLSDPPNDPRDPEKVGAGR